MKFINLLIISLLSVTVMFGQADDLKTAKKNLQKYYLDNSNTEALAMASESVTKAFATGSVDQDADANLLKGKIFNEIANSAVKAKMLEQEPAIVDPTAAATAAMALANAYQYAEKKGPKKEAVTAMVENEEIINNMAIFAYQQNDYAAAYENFNASLDVSKALTAAGGTSRLADKALMDEQMFFTAVSAYSGDMKAEAKPILMELFENGSQEVFVYDALFNIASEADDPDALKYLDAGMKVDPSDSSLLFSKINYYLTRGELNELIGSLEDAKKAEPDNVSVFTTTGSVYDQLATKASEEGDMTKSKEYFDKALENYEMAQKKDANNFDVNYSIGQLYYNKAAGLVPTINELSGDISPAGMKAYDMKKAEMDGLFKQALPYFQAAEKINDADLNTVIALKEIYARLNDLGMSNKYKAKYDELTAGK